jgi:hypothetical protein
MTQESGTEEDTAEAYRQHLAFLISQTKSRGGTRYFNQHVNRCREKAALRYPKGCAEASRKDGSFGMAIVVIAVFIAILVALAKHH